MSLLVLPLAGPALKSLAVPARTLLLEDWSDLSQPINHTRESLKIHM